MASFPSLVPPRMRRWVVELQDGSQAEVVSVANAAKLLGVARVKMDLWVETGKVVICYDAKHRVRVLVPSLVALLEGTEATQS